MIPLSDEARLPLTAGANLNTATPAGRQPIVLALIALLALVASIAAMALWRSYAGTSPERDRLVAARQLQARAAQASQELIEKTRGIEAAQQESIDQLQAMQDQLQTLRRLLAAQQAESKKLSEQVATLTEAIDVLRQSFASAQASEPSSAPAAHRSIRARAHAIRSVERNRTKSRG